MGINRIDYGGRTLLDLTQDTVTPTSLAKGVTAHDSAGNLITGTLEAESPVQQYTGVIVTTGWRKDTATGISVQVIDVPGLHENQTIIVAPDYQGDDNSFVNQKNQFLTYITNGHAESVDNGVKISIYGEAPTIKINVLVIAFAAEG